MSAYTTSVLKLLNVAVQAIAVHDHIDLTNVLTVPVRGVVLIWVKY